MFRMQAQSRSSRVTAGGLFRPVTWMHKFETPRARPGSIVPTAAVRRVSASLCASNANVVPPFDVSSGEGTFPPGTRAECGRQKHKLPQDCGGLVLALLQSSSGRSCRLLTKFINLERW